MEIEKFQPGQRVYAFRGRNLKEWIVDNAHGVNHLRCDDGIFFTAEAYEAECQAIEARRKAILKEMLKNQEAILSAEFEMMSLKSQLATLKNVKAMELRSDRTDA